MFSPCFFIHSSLVSTVMTITSNFLSGKLLITILLVAFPSCSFTGNSLLSPHFIWLPVFLLVKWNKYLFQSWRRVLCRSDFCLDYMCWVALASWLELKSVHAVPEVPWQNYWQGLERAQGRVCQGCCRGWSGHWLRWPRVWCDYCTGRIDFSDWAPTHAV